MCYRSHVDTQTKPKFMKATAKCSILLIIMLHNFLLGDFDNCFCTVTFDREGLITGGPTQSVCVTDCSFVVKDLSLALPRAIYR